MATRIMYQNRWAMGLCAASSTATAFSPDSTRNPLRGLQWRSGDVIANAWISCDLGSAQQCSALMVASPRWQGLTGTFSLQTSVDNVAWTTLTAIPTTLGRSDLWALYFTPTTSRYWRILFTFTSGVGFIEFGTIFLGPYFETVFGVNSGIQKIRQDRSALVRSGHGAISRSSRPKQNRFSVLWEAVSDIEAFRAMWEATGIGVHLFLTIDHTNLEYTWYGYWVNDMIENDVVLDLWDINIQFEEAV